MRWTALTAALGLVVLPTFAEAVDVVGRWRSTLGQEVEFKPDGTVEIAGVGNGTFHRCKDDGGNLCVDYGQNQCEFRATYDAASATLKLFSGRPTRRCPDGFFKRVEAD